MSQAYLQNDFQTFNAVQAHLDLENFYESCWQWHEPIGDLPCEPEFLIDKFLPRDYLMILSGKTKEGKSSFLSALALSVLKGTDFAGLKTKPGTVAWISGDENSTERAEVMKRSQEWRHEKLRMLYSTIDLPKIEEPRFKGTLLHAIYKHNTKLFIVDSLYGTTKSDLERHRNARKVMTILKEVADHGAAVIVLHQERGNDSIQLHATASIVAHLSHVKTRKGRLIRLACRGRGDFANKTYTFLSDNPLHYSLDRLVSEEETVTTATEDLILEALEGKELTFGQLRKETGLNRFTIRTALNNLMEDAVVTYQQHPTHRTYNKIQSAPRA